MLIMSEQKLSHEQERKIHEAIEDALQKLAELNKKEEYEREKTKQRLGRNPVILDGGPSPERAAIYMELRKKIGVIKNE